MAGSPVFSINFTNRLIPAKPKYLARLEIYKAFQDRLTILNLWKAITFLCGHSLLHDVVSPLCDVVSSLYDVVSPLRGVVSSLYDGVSPSRDVVLSLCVVVSPLCDVVLSLWDVVLPSCDVVSPLRGAVLSLYGFVIM